MATDGKDRFGSKLRDVEAAREDQWAHQRDEELLEKLRHRLNKITCPHCKCFLEKKTVSGVTRLECPEGHGAWLDANALKSLSKEKK